MSAPEDPRPRDPADAEAAQVAEDAMRVAKTIWTEREDMNDLTPERMKTMDSGPREAERDYVIDGESDGPTRVSVYIAGAYDAAMAVKSPTGRCFLVRFDYGSTSGTVYASGTVASCRADAEIVLVATCEDSPENWCHGLRPA